MDNVTHTLLGLTIGRAGVERLGALAMPTLVIAANLPDADIIVSPFGQTAYLEHHRGITHAAIGILVQIPLLAAAMWSLGRWLQRRRDEAASPRGGDGESDEGAVSPPRRPVRFLPLLTAATIGLASHPLLDLLNTYGVRPWLPVSDLRYFGDAVFIVDPWIWLVLGSAVCLTGPRGMRHGVRWAAIAAVAAVPILGSGRAPLGVGLTWIAAVGLVAALRAAGVGTARPRAAAGVALAIAVLHVAGLATASRVAAEHGLGAVRPALAPDEAVSAVSVHPQPATPWRFDVLVESPTRIRWSLVDLARGTTGSVRVLDRRLDDPALANVRETDEHRAWRLFARHPFVGRTPDGCLILGDARYHPFPAPSWCNLCVPLPGAPIPVPR